VAGKDNLRQQSAMWQAMLMSVGIKNSEKVYINSFLTSGGQKMSKSLGNVISPYEMIDKFGTDGTRYLLLSLNTFGDDMDITWQGMTEKYNADLANGLGNLVGRVSNLLEKNKIETELKKGDNKKLTAEFNQLVNDFKFDEALKILWNVLRQGDEVLSDKKPWKMEDMKEIKKVLEPIAQDILNVAVLLRSFMPEVAEKIITQFSAKQIKKGESLFPRI
jgi:methionyl-tRNA synthetase